MKLYAEESDDSFIREATKDEDSYVIESNTIILTLMPYRLPKLTLAEYRVL